MSVRVRIAPSPTGHMHVGTARTALFNYLFARQKGGSFILRLEDTDRERRKPEFEEGIYKAFEWLGLTPDEGPKQGGPHAPYRQSERTAHYRKALESLLASGTAFYCPHEAAEEEYSVHWCEARDGSREEGIIRFKSPQGRDISFSDVIRGTVTISTDTFGDFSLAKNLDMALYNLAAVVDDIEMEITDVFRGEDHIANTPKQVLIYEALGKTPPSFAHQPLILGPDRSKLSKRHGATSVIEFQEKGYLPEALLNFLALLGWNPGGEQELFTLEELIGVFSLERVQKSGAIFDTEKLEWMNGEYIRRLTISELTDRLLPFIEKAGIDVSIIPREKLEAIVALEQPRLKTLAEIGERIRFYFEPPAIGPELLRWKQMTNKDIIASLDESYETVSKLSTEPGRGEAEAALLPLAAARGDKGSLLWPLRAALTGLKASPGPFDVIAILGRDETLKRLKRTKEAIR